MSLQLLQDDAVDSVALGEADPLVASFWKVAFFDHEWLVDALYSTPVTLVTWDKLRNNPARSVRDRALACLFLNRTSFSGILAKTAGPIGGRRQESGYAIDCRFNVETIAKRIRNVAALRHRVAFVKEGSWHETLDAAKSLGYRNAEILHYFDPPFFAKAERLYRLYFSEGDHAVLRDAILRLKTNWIISYDPAPQILQLYAGNGRTPRHVDLLYSASGPDSPAPAREVIITNLARLPKRTKLWRTSAEWKRRPRGVARKS